MVRREEGMERKESAAKLLVHVLSLLSSLSVIMVMNMLMVLLDHV